MARRRLFASCGLLFLGLADHFEETLLLLVEVSGLLVLRRVFLQLQVGGLGEGPRDQIEEEHRVSPFERDTAVAHQEAGIGLLGFGARDLAHGPRTPDPSGRRRRDGRRSSIAGQC